MQKLYIDRIESALGEIVVVVDGDQLCAVDFAEYEERLQRSLQRRYGAYVCEPSVNPVGSCDYIRAYLSGELDSISNIPTTQTGTPFQQKVWSQLRLIPAGQTLTYGQLASQIGQPQASRAVGRANACNPIMIVVPCHRVVGTQNQLTGYAGGLERKRWLLEHEQSA